MTKAYSFLLFTLALLGGSLVQHWIRQEMRKQNRAELKLRLLNLMLLLGLLVLGAYLAFAAFDDWLALKPVRAGLLLGAITMAIFYLCPIRQSIPPLAASLMWFAIEFFREQILQFVLLHTSIRAWAVGTLLTLVEICLGIFILCRLLPGFTRRVLELVQRIDQH